MSTGADSVKSIFFALGANLSIALAKGAAALFTGSGALLAESVHSLADCGNQVLLLWGLRAAKRPPSPEYPLGYGKSIYFWSFIVALILFSMGGLFSIYEGVHKWSHPEALRHAWVAIGVLAFAIVAESFSLWGCLREVAKVRRGRSLWRWFRESRQSELLVVFAEDLAALMGLGLALASVLLSLATGDGRFDAAGSIAIGAVLVCVAAFLGIEIKGLLIGQSAAPDDREKIEAWLRTRPEVAEVYHVVTLQLGGELMIAVKARMRKAPSALRLVGDINRVEAAMHGAFANIRWIFFEPDVKK